MGVSTDMDESSAPIATLVITGATRGLETLGRSEAVYGGYMNKRGQIVLFAKDLAYRVNFKNRTLRERPPLNFDAKARYDSTEAGEEFKFCQETFRRLSLQQIKEICDDAEWRVGSRF